MLGLWEKVRGGALVARGRLLGPTLNRPSVFSSVVLLVVLCYCSRHCQVVPWCTTPLTSTRLQTVKLCGVYLVVVLCYCSRHCQVVPWCTTPLTSTRLQTVKLCGLPLPHDKKHADSVIPKTVQV